MMEMCFMGSQDGSTLAQEQSCKKFYIFNGLLKSFISNWRDSSEISKTDNRKKSWWSEKINLIIQGNSPAVLSHNENVTKTVLFRFLFGFVPKWSYQLSTILISSPWSIGEELWPVKVTRTGKWIWTTRRLPKLVRIPANYHQTQKSNAVSGMIRQCGCCMLTLYKTTMDIF